MANVLTPVEIWQNFKVPKKIEYEIISEKVVGDLLVSRIYIHANKTEDGQTKIYGIFARNIQISFSPALLIMQNLSQTVDEDFCIEMAKQGYQSLIIDLAGKKDGAEYFTLYPDSLCYANYENAKGNPMGNAEDIKNTCWYEWGVLGRYAYNFLKTRPYVTKTGIVAMRDACFSLWQTSAMEKDIACSVFMFNAGWSAYRGNYKFSNQPEPELTDGMIGYLAGVEPQSYAKHVKCPTLILTSTNSRKYDCDRAYDTKSRIAGYSAIDYSVNRSGSINSSAFKNFQIFLNEFLLKDEKGKNLPEDLDVKASLENGKIKVEVNADSENLEEICLYSSEQEINPALRCWMKTDKLVSRKEGKYSFEYSPYKHSGIAFFFARAKYKSGFCISSNVVAKKFNEKEIVGVGKSNIIYSSREQFAESVFTVKPNEFSSLNYLDISNKAEVTVEKGPMNILGVYSSRGLATYWMNTLNHKPQVNAMLMVDAFFPQGGVLEVKLTANCLTNPVCYTARVNIPAGQVWNNVKIDMNKFKTEEGKSLQNYSSIECLEFNSDVKYLINNVLWV